MWIVEKITEADYGCEERMPGEPITALVYLESDDGRQCRFEVAEDWLKIQGIDEGDEWPEDIDDDSALEQVVRQNEFMNNYLDALSEMDDEL